MTQDWWEFYEGKGRVKNLNDQIAQLKKDVKKLQKEVAELKKDR